MPILGRVTTCWYLELDHLGSRSCSAACHLGYFEMGLHFRLWRVPAHLPHAIAWVIYFTFPLFGSLIYCLFGSQSVMHKMRMILSGDAKLLQRWDKVTSRRHALESHFSLPALLFFIVPEFQQWSHHEELFIVFYFTFAFYQFLLVSQHHLHNFIHLHDVL